MATAIYMRVSTEKQSDKGESLNTQKEQLYAYCKLKGLSNIKEYVDIGSGRTTDKRVNYNRMMDDAQNKFITNIVVFKLDRLTRSIIDLNKLVIALNDVECGLHSTQDDINTTTANGRLMLNLIGMFAQWESETISERVKINMQSLAEKGIWQSAPPFGFDLVNQRLVINEKEKDILNEAFDMVIEGSSFNHAENKIKHKYNLDWHLGFLIKKVRSPSTIGNMFRNDVTIENIYPPLISREKYKKLKLIIDERGNPRQEIFTGDLFRRKIACPLCDNIMSLRANKSTKTKQNLYSYSCMDCQRKRKVTVSISESLIEQAFLRYLNRGKITYSEDDIKSEDKTKEISNLKRELQSLEQEKNRIQKAWIKGFIEENDLIEHQKETDEQIEKVELRLKELSDAGISIEEISEIHTTLVDNYEHMTKNERVTFIQRFIRRIEIDRKLLKGYKKKYSINVKNILFY